MKSSKLFKGAYRPDAVARMVRLVVTKLALCARPKTTVALRRINNAMDSLGAVRSPDKVALGDFKTTWAMPGVLASVRTWHQEYVCTNSTDAMCTVTVSVERLTQIKPDSVMYSYWGVRIVVANMDDGKVLMDKGAAMEQLCSCLEKLTARLETELDKAKEE